MDYTFIDFTVEKRGVVIIGLNVICSSSSHTIVVTRFKFMSIMEL